MGASADGIVNCACGSKHWGHAGAAGVLAWRNSFDPEVIMQLRAGWSMSGGTWGIPGGAIDYGESPLRGGIREAREEAGLGPARVWANTTLHHPNWSYTTAIAEASAGQRAIATDHESDAMEWVPWRNLHDRLLMPAFEQSTPLLEALLGRTLLITDPGILPSGWEHTLPRLATSGMPIDILPDVFRTPIEKGLEASSDGIYGRTVSLFPDFILLGQGKPLKPMSPSGSIPPLVDWAPNVDRAIMMGDYARVLTVGVDIGDSHTIPLEAFHELLS